MKHSSAVFCIGLKAPLKHSSAVFCIRLESLYEAQLPSILYWAKVPL